MRRVCIHYLSIRRLGAGTRASAVASGFVFVFRTLMHLGLRYVLFLPGLGLSSRQDLNGPAVAIIKVTCRYVSSVSTVVLQYMFHALCVTIPLCFPTTRGRNHDGYMAPCLLFTIHNPARVRSVLKVGQVKRKCLPSSATLGHQEPSPSATNFQQSTASSTAEPHWLYGSFHLTPK